MTTNRFKIYFPILYYTGEFFVILLSTHIMLAYTFTKWTFVNDLFIALWFLISIGFKSHVIGRDISKFKLIRFISLRFSLIKVGGIYFIKLIEKSFSETFLTANGWLIILTFLEIWLSKNVVYKYRLSKGGSFLINITFDFFRLKFMVFIIE